MSGRKNSLVFAALTAGQMANNLTSAVTNIKRLDNFGYQGVFTGTPTGTFGVDVSASYQQDYLGNVLSAGTWTSLTLAAAPTAAGAGSNFFLDMNKQYITMLSAPWIRMRWVSTATFAQTITTVADVSKSLASKYFLIQTANNAINYYVWFKVSGTGVDPAVAGYTGVEVDIATNDTAGTIATAVAAALDALAGFVSAAVGAVVTSTNASSGPAVPAYDSTAAPTGFAFAGTTGAGLLTLTFTGKMI